MKKNWILYGANGFTGELIARKAKEQGFTPILAGRSQEKIKFLARELNLPYLIFSLHQPLTPFLQDAALLLNCAGPFSQTALPLMNAALKTQTHYLDITGEIEVFEEAHQLHSKAQAAKTVLCPGVGFDVVPTDCLAALLSEKLPDAQSLALGFASQGKMGPGTLKTALEGLAKGGRVRQDGKICSVPLSYKTRMIDFGRGPRTAVTIPWGDVATAYFSTGIPNIEVYMAQSPSRLNFLKKIEYLRPLLGWPWILNLLQKYAGSKMKGPNTSERSTGKTFLWGEVQNAKGQTLTARREVGDGYEVTIFCALACVEKLLGPQTPPAGYLTPSQILGSDFLLKIPGKDLELSSS